MVNGELQWFAELFAIHDSRFTIDDSRFTNCSICSQRSNTQIKERQLIQMVKEGSTAPAFKTTDANGEAVNLKDYRGQKVVLYFYPKDDTPGCTKEACSFRDSFSKFKKQGIVVLGVSPDSEASHKKFAAKYKLPFTLLADKDRSISETYGVYGEKKFMGRTYMGVHRTTFLIDEKGKIKKVFEKVKPDEHASEVLEAFAE
jgi:thioredoxin-dependent peroxiredoxin